jgi:hypothetical protein
MPRVIVCDVNETLLDVAALEPDVKDGLPSGGSPSLGQTATVVKTCDPVPNCALQDLQRFPGMYRPRFGHHVTRSMISGTTPCSRSARPSARPAIPPPTIRSREGDGIRVGQLASKSALS